jgi:hypothetical protein
MFESCNLVIRKSQEIFGHCECVTYCRSSVAQKIPKSVSIDYLGSWKASFGEEKTSEKLRIISVLTLGSLDGAGVCIVVLGRS